MKKNKSRKQDPHLVREQAQYEHPIPSREFILETLTEQGVPLSAQKLAAALGVSEDEMEVFGRRLRAMERDGQIVRNRKDAICVADKLDLIRGTIQGHADGFGFLIPDDGSPDLFLGLKEMHKVLHGDRVMGRENGTDRRGKREGMIVEVLERVNTRVVGRLFDEHGILFVVAENKRINQDLLVPQGANLNAKPGQVVMVEIMEQPSRNSQAIARVVEVLGNYADPGMEIEIALRKHELPYEFPDEVEQLSKKLPKKVLKKDYAGREDIRDLPLVTIDGETARDFDDAVYCETKGSGFRLVVAIADVSYYVQTGDALDKEAFNRGNSVYFPRRVIPMLPEVLSNGLCSLNPQVDRMCMVCDMQIDHTGDITAYRFYPSVMFSQARLTYTKVAAMLEDPAGPDAQEYKALLPHIKSLNNLFKVLLKARKRRGAIDFETVETQMVFSNDGKIERVIPVKRNDAHRIIEECMLAANVCTAHFLQEHKQPALYRVHEGPSTEKRDALRDFLKEFGLQLGGGENPRAADYAVLLEQIKSRPDAHLLQTVMLRSLHQAVYTPDNVGHFGLSYDAYTHFTSPIRRYPDLLIHRAIKAVLNQEQYKPGDWHKLGIHCSMTERRADDATRDVEAWLKCYFMQDKINESFDGTISSATGFGIFVLLDDIYIEGLVHVSELGEDYFKFDATRHQLLGERSGKRYRLGDRLRVKVVRVSMDTTKIDFMLDPLVPESKKSTGKPAASTARQKSEKPVAKKKPAGDKKTKGGKTNRRS